MMISIWFVCIDSVPALLYNTYNGEFNDVKGCSIANSVMHFSWMELIEFAVQMFRHCYLQSYSTEELLFWENNY